jgi:hypothetical protein
MHLRFLLLAIGSAVVSVVALLSENKVFIGKLGRDWREGPTTDFSLLLRWEGFSGRRDLMSVFQGWLSFST